MRLFVITALTAVLSCPAAAQSWTEPDWSGDQTASRYSYLAGAALTDSEVELANSALRPEEMDGYRTEMSVAVTEQAFFALQYESIDNNRGDIDNFRASLGGILSPSKSIDVYGAGVYEELTFSVPGAGTHKTDGWGIRAGTRWYLHDRIELHAEAGYTHYGEQAPDLDLESDYQKAGIAVTLLGNIALTADYRISTYELTGPSIAADVDRKGPHFGFRWYFDK